MAMKDLGEAYRKACREGMKKDMHDAIDRFIDDDTVDGAYKDRVMGIVTGLLSLRQP